MLANDMDVIRAGVMNNVGIGVLPAFLCVSDLRARKLERVLGGWDLPATPIHVVYPSTRHVSPKVKRFVEHVHTQMTPPPWELGPAP
jgi:DNA-binding transcriptional LysR family regulator